MLGLGLGKALVDEIIGLIPADLLPLVLPTLIAGALHWMLKPLLAVDDILHSEASDA